MYIKQSYGPFVLISRWFHTFKTVFAAQFHLNRSSEKTRWQPPVASCFLRKCVPLKNEGIMRKSSIQNLYLCINYHLRLVSCPPSALRLPNRISFIFERWPLSENGGAMFVFLDLDPSLLNDRIPGFTDCDRNETIVQYD